MEVSVAGFVFSIIESFICEIVLSKSQSYFAKIKLNKFLKKLKEKLEVFCSRNECAYLDSSAFQFFLKSSGVIQKTIERAVSVNVKVCNKEFYNLVLKEARNIAKEEEVTFSHSEEMIIKDLCKLIHDNISDFYNVKLSVEQRRVVSILATEIMELRNNVENYTKENKEANSKILAKLQDMSELGDSKAEAIVSILGKMAWEGRFDDIETWLPVIQGKSEDLENAVKVLKYAFKDNVKGELLSFVKSINCVSVRDIVIKNIIPVLRYNEEDIFEYESLASSATLKDIILELSNDNYGVLFGEKVEIYNGVEVHSFEFNKKYVLEEGWLMRQVLAVRLHMLNIRNTYEAIENVVTGHSNWLTDLFIVNKKIDVLGSENYKGDNTAEICKNIKLLIERKKLYSESCQKIKVLFYSMLFKADVFTRWEFSFSDDTPSDICNKEPIVGYLIQKRIDKKNITLKEVQDYCNKMVLCQDLVQNKMRGSAS